MAERGTVLAINAGSSSIKFALFGTGLDRLLGGELSGIGSRPVPAARFADGRPEVAESWDGPGDEDAPALIRRLIDWIEAHAPAGRLAAIGHRVAIGGLDHSGPALLSPPLLETLRRLVPLAPLHQPRNLEPMEILIASHPHVPQVACFDTAFHRTLPREAELYGLPRALIEAGARRYGFHGLSYEYIAGRLAGIDRRAAEGRTIVCHLGSGASLCAMQAGRSVATTMGFSPLSGLVMATRPGDLDPGLMIWLLRERGMSVDEVEHMLYRDAGLKGVSGIGGEMRALLASDDPRAKEAVGLFVYSVVTEIGRLAAALGGLDAIVFTAGIGENAPQIRQAVCDRLHWLGLRLDPDRNRANARRISGTDSRVAVWVVPTDEELMVASHAVRLALTQADAKEEAT